MSWNWLEVSVIILLLAGLVIGMKKGALRIAVTFAAIILTFVITTFATPVITKVIEDYTPMNEMIGSAAAKAFYDEETNEEIIISRTEQKEAIEDASFPKAFAKFILNNNNEEGYISLGAKTFTQYIENAFARCVISIVVFGLLLFIIGIVLRAIILAFDFITKIPVLGLVNRIAGGVLGVANSLAILWIVFAFMILFERTVLGRIIYEGVENSSLLTVLYVHNPILKIILKI